MKDQYTSLPPVPIDDLHEVQSISKYYSPQRLDGARPLAGRANIAISDTFDLIGGVPRLALWADRNPGQFYTKLYARTLVAESTQNVSGQITIISSIPRSPLDGEYEDVTDDGDQPKLLP
jgi:hypothetical protein